jgi:molybdopterin/thiamine biosynthesis adenylyltransferase
MVNHMRHSGLFAPCEYPIVLIGAGGIGSSTAIMLSKMSDGEIQVYDDDNVEGINIATQFYRMEDIGQNKANAISAIANQFSDTTLFNPIPKRYPFSRQKTAWMVISGVDSIESRKAIWQALQLAMDWKWYLDARMGAEKFELYCIAREDTQWYSSLLSRQHDELIPDEPCTAKATFYTAAFAAGHIGKTIRKILACEKPPVWLSHDIYTDRILLANGYQTEVKGSQVVTCEQ